MHLYYEHDQVSLYYTNRMFVKRFFFFSDFFSLGAVFCCCCNPKIYHQLPPLACDKLRST